MARDNGTVHVRTLRRDLVVRMGKIFRAQTSAVGDTAVPEELPFKYIVERSSINPGPDARHYETDMLLTDADIERMTMQERIRIIIDRGPWNWLKLQRVR